MAHNKYEKYLYRELEQIENFVKTAKNLITVHDKKNSKDVLEKAAQQIEKVLNGTKSYLYK